MIGLSNMESPSTLGFKITGEQSIERMAPLTFEASFSNFQQRQFISQSEQVFETVNCNIIPIFLHDILI
jgi:hypothetical protein